MAWASGQRLQGGKYTIEQELGEGGFGITYRARDNNGRKVVIKTLNDNVQRRSDFAKFQQDFLNEALRLAKCSHPHIVRIDEVIQEGQLWCIVMEYIDGEDLASRIESKGALQEAEALRYIQQIAKALAVVHNNGLLHRDVKPQNIMLRSDKSEAVLIDFGIAREFTPNLTQTHTQFLSDGFAPIEQYEQRAKRGAYTDVYGLAATLYALLTGRVPPSATSRDRSVLKRKNDPIETPKQINSSISDRVNQAILWGMAIEPEDRPQSVQEWLALFKRDDLSSSVGIDYRKLRDLLASGKWKGADEETLAIMLKICGREKQGWLGLEHLATFPCQDLHTIDQLWVRYSSGRFGFSTQKRIWQSCGGNKNADFITWGCFCDRIGWRVNGIFAAISEVRRNAAQHPHLLPTGCLPGVFGCLWFWTGFWGDWSGIWERVGVFFSRVETCGL